MKSCLSVGLFYNCQPAWMGLWWTSEREFVGRIRSKALFMMHRFDIPVVLEWSEEIKAQSQLCNSKKYASWSTKLALQVPRQ